MMTVMRRRKRARKARRMLIMLQTILQLLPLLLLLLKRKNLSLLRRSWKLNKVSRVILKTKWKIESFVKYHVIIFSLHHIMFTGIRLLFFLFPQFLTFWEVQNIHWLLSWNWHYNTMALNSLPWYMIFLIYFFPLQTWGKTWNF